MHLYLTEDVLVWGRLSQVELMWGWGRCSCPGLMCVAQAMSSWEVLGSTHVHRGAVSHCGAFLKSAVTTLVYLELCVLNSFCFVIFLFYFFYYHSLAY